MTEQPTITTQTPPPLFDEVLYADAGAVRLGKPIGSRHLGLFEGHCPDGSRCLVRTATRTRSDDGDSSTDSSRALAERCEAFARLGAAEGFCPLTDFGWAKDGEQCWLMFSLPHPPQPTDPIATLARTLPLQSSELKTCLERLLQILDTLHRHKLHHGRICEHGIIILPAENGSPRPYLVDLRLPADFEATLPPERMRHAHRNWRTDPRRDDIYSLSYVFFHALHPDLDPQTLSHGAHAALGDSSANWRRFHADDSADKTLNELGPGDDAELTDVIMAGMDRRDRRSPATLLRSRAFSGHRSRSTSRRWAGLFLVLAMAVPIVHMTASLGGIQIESDRTPERPTDSEKPRCPMPSV